MNAWASAAVGGFLPSELWADVDGVAAATINMANSRWERIMAGSI
jgi:hypothetical protein